jgi:hypothetical protein
MDPGFNFTDATPEQFVAWLRDVPGTSDGSSLDPNKTLDLLITNWPDVQSDIVVEGIIELSHQQNRELPGSFAVAAMTLLAASAVGITTKLASRFIQTWAAVAHSSSSVEVLLECNYHSRCCELLLSNPDVLSCALPFILEFGLGEFYPNNTRSKLWWVWYQGEPSLNQIQQQWIIDHPDSLWTKWFNNEWPGYIEIPLPERLQ